MSYKTTLRHVIEELQRQNRRRQGRERPVRQPRTQQQDARTPPARSRRAPARAARPVRTWGRSYRPRMPARSRT